MRHIDSDNIISVSADNENVNFPIENIQDEHPRRVYKAEEYVNTATVTLGVVGGCDSFILAGTNATGVDVSVEDPNAIEWRDGSEWRDDSYWVNRDFSASATVTQRSDSEALWLDLDEAIGVPALVSLTLMSTVGTTLQVGVIRANSAESYEDEDGDLPIDPDYGLSESRIDYSIIDTNSNGSEYYKKRDIVRTFGVSVFMPTSKYYKLMESYDTYGQQPMGWKLTDIESNNWVVFGKFDGPPVGTYNHHFYTNVTFTITEVL